MMLLTPKSRDLGEFSVRRVLPSRNRRMVGPFIFFDHMGPVDFEPGEGIDVRPHPHIGLATVTYLFDGEILHRDSLGYVQAIRPGAVNLMTAGAGIVHSERTSEDLRRTGQRLHGIQTWMALPASLEFRAPAFEHYPADSLPRFSAGDATGTVIIGACYDVTSPVAVDSPTLYVDVALPAGGTVDLPGDATELAVYVATGACEIGGETVREGTMAVLEGQERPSIRATADARLLLAGGDPVGEREIWWNFVASDARTIDEAARRWQDGGFDAVPDETDFIPLPDEPPRR